ncbi:MAG: CPBP family intramembrane glutamic endopeptidase [Bacillota bacterium]
MVWVRRIALFPVTRLALYLLLASLGTGLLDLLLPGWAAGAAGAVLAYLALGRWVERRSLEEIGLGRAHLVSHLLGGFALGGVMIGLAVGALAAQGWYRVEGIAWSWPVLWSGLAGWLRVALYEEIAARGVLFRSVEESLGSWIALGVSALLFGLGHGLNAGATPISLLAITLEAGILLGAAYLLTRSLWLAIGIHWGWNFVQGTLLGATVSGNPSRGMLRAVVEGPTWATGGAFGPEAGLPALLVGTVTGVLLLARAVRAGRLRPPRWRR